MNNQDNNLNDVVKSSLWYTISNFLVKALGFLTVPLFSRLMTKTELGDYTNFLVWLDILSIIVSFSVANSINRARFDFPGEFDRYCCSILLYGSVATAVFYGVFCAIPHLFERFMSVDSVYIHAMFVYQIVAPAFSIYLGQQRIRYKYKMSVFLSVISALLTTIASIILVLTMQDKFKARVIGYIAPWFLLCVPIYVLLVFRGKSCGFKYFKYAFFYSWPFIPHLLSTKLLSASDMLMIKKFCGSEYTAIYSIAHSCCTIVSIFATSINTAVSPWVFDLMQKKEYGMLKKITLPYSLIFTIPCIGVMLVAPEVLLILGGRGYSDSRKVIAPLMASVVFQFMYFLYVNVEQYSRKTWAIAAGTAIATVINISLNYLLIPRIGYVAAAYTTLAGYFVLFFIHFFFVNLIGFKHLYDEKYVFLTLAVVLLIIPFVIWSYNHTIVRYAAIVAVFIIGIILMWLKKDWILSLLRKRKIEKKT